MRSSIDGFIDAALLVGVGNARTKNMPESADIDNVRILRVDHNPADLPRVLQPYVTPRGAAVSGFVDAVTGREIFANVALAGPGIDSLSVGGSHGQRPDRGHWLAVKDWCPDNSGVGRFPYPAIDRAKIKRRRVARNAGHSHHASPAKRADQAPFQPTHQFRRNRLGNGGDG